MFRKNLVSKRNADCFSTLVEVQPKYPRFIVKDKVKDKANSIKNKLRHLPTVEEKAIELNINKYYGHICYQIDDLHVNLKTLKHVQFLTRSNIINGWPHSQNEKLNQYIPILKERLEQCLMTETQIDPRITDFEESLKTFSVAHSVSKCINRAVLMTLSPDYDHIARCCVDLDPRQEAFWFCAGVPPFQQMVTKRRKAYRQSDEQCEERIIMPVQQCSLPTLQLRYDEPLPRFVDALHPKSVQESPLDLAHRVPPAFKVDVRRRHGVNVCGMWSGADNTFVPLNYTTFRPLKKLLTRSYITEDSADFNSYVDAHGCMNAFGLALSQATTNGFFPYSSLTYPICTHSVLTDGFRFRLYAFQLNTIEQLHHDMSEGTPANICWISEPMHLFEGGSLNDSLLLKLLQMYTLAPSRGGISELQPYLDPQRGVDKLENSWLRRKYMESFFHVMSNKPRQRTMPEIYLWEKIYKIQFKTRPQDAKKRFFERDINPYNRRLDEFYPRYVPKHERPDSLGKREKRLTRLEKNEFHEMARLRNMRDEDPKFMQELKQMKSWGDEEVE